MGVGREINPFWATWVDLRAESNQNMGRPPGSSWLGTKNNHQSTPISETHLHPRAFDCVGGGKAIIIVVETAEELLHQGSHPGREPGRLNLQHKSSMGWHGVYGWHVCDCHTVSTSNTSIG